MPFAIAVQAAYADQIIAHSLFQVDAVHYSVTRQAGTEIYRSFVLRWK